MPDPAPPSREAANDDHKRGGPEVSTQSCGTEPAPTGSLETRPAYRVGPYARDAPAGYSGVVTSTAPKPGSGPSTKNISIVMSGSTWACDRKATTVRPVRSSIVSLYRLAIISWN